MSSLRPLQTAEVKRTQLPGREMLHNKVIIFISKEERRGKVLAQTRPAYEPR